MSRNKILSRCQDPMRRNVLKWSPPLISVVVLPSHAQTSICLSAPVMVASVAAKCAGSPPVGQAVLTILSDAADPLNDQIEIRAIVASGVDASDTITIPSLPANVIDTIGLDIQWTGNSADAVTCLPTSSITFEITYACSTTGPDEFANFDMTTVLAAAIP